MGKLVLRNILAHVSLFQVICALCGISNNCPTKCALYMQSGKTGDEAKFYMKPCMYAFVNIPYIYAIYMTFIQSFVLIIPQYRSSEPQI